MLVKGDSTIGRLSQVVSEKHQVHFIYLVWKIIFTACLYSVFLSSTNVRIVFTACVVSSFLVEMLKSFSLPA